MGGGREEGTRLEWTLLLTFRPNVWPQTIANQTLVTMANWANYGKIWRTIANYGQTIANYGKLWQTSKLWANYSKLWRTMANYGQTIANYGEL